ncbi:transglutaminase-like domain-containing protein [Xaviernesmea oryzae]|nr:transglutaminase-like domain-containing protein [Xaviernesmea oryzae]
MNFNRLQLDPHQVEVGEAKMKRFCLAVLVLCLPLTNVMGQTADAPAATLQERTEALFKPSLDLLDVKLTVDAMVDASVRIDVVKAEIDRMATTIAAMAGENGDEATRLNALKRYLYESGVWNQNNPFRYDLSDPLGSMPANRLLQRYLVTRRGNCVTMPILFVVLGQRIGLRMTLVEAPLHLFVKYTDADGKAWNLEPTSGGGFTRDEWYRQKLPMSDKAVANGVYLRALSHEESVAVIASFLLEHEIDAGQFENALSVSDILLRHYPNFAYGLVKRGSAYHGLLRRELATKYSREEDIPPDLKAEADQWYRQNAEAFAKAEALGWRPQDGEAR